MLLLSVGTLMFNRYVRQLDGKFFGQISRAMYRFIDFWIIF